MNFDPQKFFIGLMDFFSILLPGALLTWLLMGEVGSLVLGARYVNLAGAQAWAAFLFASYLFGHLVFLLGSWLDEFYDWARRHTLNTQITRLARRDRLLPWLAHRDRLLPWLARALIWLVFKGERNLAVDRATRIKQQALGALQAQEAINTFQWSKAWLNTVSPASLAVVQRFEADSKFFRCFAVVLLLLLAAWPWQHHWPLYGIPVVLVLLLLALWRFMEQRYKATNQAYWFVITLTAKDGKLAFDKAVRTPDRATRAGGVVYRMRGNIAEYLLVEVKKDPKQWVLPKGDVEEGESDREAAVRGVHEKAGVWAEITHDLHDVSYMDNGCVVKVHFFLMRAVGKGLRKDKDREHHWLPLTEAVGRASYVESRELLQAAEMNWRRV